MNVIYRAKSAITPEVVLTQQKQGLDVQDANQVISFPDLQDRYKIGCYNAALKYGNMLSLEQAFQAAWYKEYGTKAHVHDMPNLLEFVLPQEYYPTDPNIKFIHECINPNAENTSIYKLIIIDKQTEVIVKGHKLPDSLVKDFGYLAHIGTHLDKMPVMLQQLWYQRDKVYYPCTEDEILEQVKNRAMLSCHAAPGSQKGQHSLSCERGLIEKIFGYVIPAFMMKKIVYHMEFPKLTTGANAPDTSGLEVESGQVGPTVLEFDLVDFVVFLLDKYRPHRTGRGTLPFNISPLALLSSFLWETRKEIPHINIRNLPTRKELVTLMNQAHQYEYGKWLDEHNKENSNESVLEYFETIKHWSQSDSTIKKGRALFKNRPQRPRPAFLGIVPIDLSDGPDSIVL